MSAPEAHGRLLEVRIGDEPATVVHLSYREM